MKKDYKIKIDKYYSANGFKNLIVEKIKVNKNFEGKVIIPDGVTRIGEFAFYQCKGLKEVVIPKSVDSIGKGAFYDCEDLKNIKLPKTIKTIGTGAFAHCKNLKYVDIELESENVDEEKSYNNDNSEKDVFPASLISVANSIFPNSKELDDIVFPKPMITIGNSAFCECEQLTRVNIPSVLTDIREKAFINCKNLEYINLDKDSQIDKTAFLGCDKLNLDIERDNGID